MEGAPPPPGAATGAEIAAAAVSGPAAIHALLSQKLEQVAPVGDHPTQDAGRPDGWLYLQNPADRADYKELIPLVKTFPNPEAGVAVEVPDQAKLEKLDRVYQMPPSFKSIDEARAWKPELGPQTGEWNLVDSLNRAAARRPPFADIDQLPKAEQDAILRDPRRAYATKIGLLDGTMPALPPPFAPDARPNPWLYLTDKGQQRIIEGRVPKVGVSDPETSQIVRLAPDRETLDKLDTLYEMPPRFASVEEAKAWHREKRSHKPGDDVLAIAVFNNTVAEKRPWSHIDQFPPEVQKAIIADPRLAYAGLKGLIPQDVPEGFQPMRAHPTPSGRYASFEENMGGYHPKWAPEAKWVPGSGIMLPKDAEFVAHRQKQDFMDFLGDKLLPGVAQFGASLITGGLGFVGSTAFNAAAAATQGDKPLRSAGLSVVGSLAGAALEPAVQGFAQNLGDTLGSRVAGSVLARGAAGALTAAAFGGDAALGALGGAASGAISAARWSFDPEGAAVGRVTPPDNIPAVEIEGGPIVGRVTPPEQVLATELAPEVSGRAVAGEPSDALRDSAGNGFVRVSSSSPSASNGVRPIPNYVPDSPDPGVYRQQLERATSLLQAAGQVEHQARAYAEASQSISTWHSENEQYLGDRGMQRARALIDESQVLYIKAQLAAQKAARAAPSPSESTAAMRLFGQAAGGEAAAKYLSDRLLTLRISI
ncbi:MAG: hypothetical protein IT384_15980 [Deltaproteobacteria bacterium]|nr:hypothetical protein [Deltaproteobacteria bacterium]